MADGLAGIGILLILAGFAIVVFSLFSKGDVKIGVGGVIGFIPFGFGNDPHLAKVVLAVSVIFAMIFLIAFLRGSGII